MERLKPTVNLTMLTVADLIKYKWSKGLQGIVGTTIDIEEELIRRAKLLESNAAVIAELEDLRKWLTKYMGGKIFANYQGEILAKFNKRIFSLKQAQDGKEGIDAKD